MEKIMIQWEDIDNLTNTQRLRVYGGWIVKHVSYFIPNNAVSESSVFVPDPNHEWDLNDEVGK